MRPRPAISLLACLALAAAVHAAPDDEIVRLDFDEAPMSAVIAPGGTDHALLIRAAGAKVRLAVTDQATIVEGLDGSPRGLRFMDQREGTIRLDLLLEEPPNAGVVRVRWDLLVSAWVQLAPGPDLQLLSGDQVFYQFSYRADTERFDSVNASPSQEKITLTDTPYRYELVIDLDTQRYAIRVTNLYDGKEVYAAQDRPLTAQKWSKVDGLTLVRIAGGRFVTTPSRDDRNVFADFDNFLIERVKPSGKPGG